MTTDKITDTETLESEEGKVDTVDNPVAVAIAEAEEVPDPLEGLAERVPNDPGAPFEPETMEAIVALKKRDRAGYEILRKSLKDAGCRMVGFEEALKDSGGGATPEPSQADILTDLADDAELFHSADGTAFGDIRIDGHRETWPVRAKGFRRWLTQQFFDATGGAPTSEALSSALNVIEAKAHFEGPELPVFIRVGGVEDNLYLDLCDDTWNAVEVTSTGWRVVEEPPVRFRRTVGMLPLPEPKSGGSVDALRSFLNVKSDNDFVLVVAWALRCCAIAALTQ